MEEIKERYELAMERIRAMKQEKTVFKLLLGRQVDGILRRWRTSCWKWMLTGRTWKRENRSA